MHNPFQDKDQPQHSHAEFLQDEFQDFHELIERLSTNNNNQSSLLSSSLTSSLGTSLLSFCHFIYWISLIAHVLIPVGVSSPWFTSVSKIWIKRFCEILFSPNISK